MYSDVHAKSLLDAKSLGANPVERSRPYGWLDLKFDAPSTVEWLVPMTFDSFGYSTIVNITLHNLNISSSVNYASVYLCQKTEVCNSETCVTQYSLNTKIF